MGRDSKGDNFSGDRDSKFNFGESGLEEKIIVYGVRNNAEVLEANQNISSDIERRSKRLRGLARIVKYAFSDAERVELRRNLDWTFAGVLRPELVKTDVSFKQPGEYIGTIVGNMSNLLAREYVIHQHQIFSSIPDEAIPEEAIDEGIIIDVESRIKNGLLRVYGLMDEYGELRFMRKNIQNADILNGVLNNFNKLVNDYRFLITHPSGVWFYWAMCLEEIGTRIESSEMFWSSYRNASRILSLIKSPDKFRALAASTQKDVHDGGSIVPEYKPQFERAFRRAGEIRKI